MIVKEMNNPTILFIQEIILRFGAKSPKFFQTIKTILMVTTIITGVPQMLIMFGVELPDAIAFFANKLIALASFVSFVLSNLPVEQTEKPIVVEIEKTITENNAVYLPFSDIYALKY